ncbi:MAG: hypothetical protein MHM6MM_003869 [Cercozoa sp. M6MM]
MRSFLSQLRGRRQETAEKAEESRVVPNSNEEFVSLPNHHCDFSVQRRVLSEDQELNRRVAANEALVARAMQRNTVSMSPCGTGNLLSVRLQKTLPITQEEAVRRGIPTDRPLRLVCMSDTHSRLKTPEFAEVLENFPSADILLHAGDFTSTGKLAELQQFNAFCKALKDQGKVKEVVVIAGNHDLTLDAPHYIDRAGHRFHGHQRESPKECWDALTDVTLLQDASIEVYGLKIHGSPWQPEFYDWAFNLPPNTERIRVPWRAIPADADIVLTHGPVQGLGSLCKGGNHAGCELLLQELAERVRPLLHVCGHIHEDYGAFVLHDQSEVSDDTNTSAVNTVFLNASTCTLRYRPTQPPVLIDVHLAFLPTTDSTSAQ